jgi:NAD(P)-dependent dehydrogenase (short-subunit alcohol dehydrogenase family)
LSMESDGMRGRIALITGGGRGLGRAFALGLAAAGAAVAVIARSEEQIEETARMVREAGGKALAVRADVADPSAVDAMARRVEKELGPVDVLVNNAGAGGVFGPSWEADADKWWSCMETNVRGPFLCARAFLPGMIARRRGSIINVASGAGAIKIPYMSAYVISKAALIKYTELLAAEAGPHGISAFAIQPGTVRTAMLDEILNSPEASRWLPWVRQIVDAGQDVTPDAAVQLVLLLTSGRADALSGRMLGIHDDVEDLIRRADEVKRDDLYALRLRRPEGK